MDWGSIGSAIGQGLLEVVLPGVATLAAGQSVRLLGKLAKKQDLDLSAAQEERVRRIVADAIMRTEELARRSQTMTGDQKRTATTDAVLHELRIEGEAPSREAVGKMIDTALPAVRAKIEPNIVVLDAATQAP